MTNTNTTGTNATDAATNAVSAATNGPVVLHHDTPIGQLLGYMFGSDSSTLSRLAFIVGITALLLLLVKGVKNFSNWLIYKNHEKKNPLGLMTQQPKFITVTWLIVSAISFTIYFLAVGMILREVFDLDLRAYMASASIIGLAVSFGSQGLVQDIVTGLTLIFSDAMDVGDLVEIVGSATVSGRVEKIGLRFTTLVNFYNQRVLIPNRTIANVSRFPQGGVDAYGDVHVPDKADPKMASEIVNGIAKGMKDQFAGIIFGDPTVMPVDETADGKVRFFRVHFRIWPGQQSLIETTFRSRVVSAFKVLDENYTDWMVPVTYRAMAPVKK